MRYGIDFYVTFTYTSNIGIQFLGVGRVFPVLGTVIYLLEEYFFIRNKSDWSWNEISVFGNRRICIWNDISLSGMIVREWEYVFSIWK